MAFSAIGQIAGGIIEGQAAKEAGKQQARGSEDAFDLLKDFLGDFQSNNEPFLRVGQGAAGLLGELFLGQAPQVRVSNPAFESLQRELSNTAPVINTPVENRENDIRGDFTASANPAFTRLSSELSRTNPQITIDGPEARPLEEIFQASPDFQFRRDQGVEALDRSASSRGLLLSGAQTQRVQDFGQQLASQEFTNFANRLFSLAGFGQTAQAQQGAVGLQGNIAGGNFLENAGLARASGTIGQAAGTSKAVQGFGNLLSSGTGFVGGGGFGGR